MHPEIIDTKHIKVGYKIIDVMIEKVEAFTVMGLTCKFTDPTGQDGVDKNLIDDFTEEAKYYGINTDTTYAVTVEPSFVAGVNWPPARHAFYFTYGVAVNDELVKSAPFVFCLRRIPAGIYGRVTVRDAEVGLAYAAFDKNIWEGDGPKPNWALNFQRHPSKYETANDKQPMQDFYVSLGTSRDFILKEFNAANR